MIKRGHLAAWLLRGVSSAFLAWRLLSLNRSYPASELVQAGFGAEAWTWEQVITQSLIFAMALIVLWGMCLQARRQPASASRTLLAVLVAAGSAIVFVLAGSLTIGQLMRVATAALGGCGCAVFLLRIKHGLEAAPGPWLAIWCGLMLLAFLFVEGGMTSAQVALLVVSFVAAHTALPHSLRWQIGFRTVACLLPLALTLAVNDFTSSPQDQNPYQDWSS